MSLTNAQKYEQALMAQHDNAPAPFNPDYDPRAADWSAAATKSLVDREYYSNYTREECAIEWRRQYDLAKEADRASTL